MKEKLLFLLLFIPTLLFSQVEPRKILHAKVINGDTIPQVYLDEYMVVEKRTFKNKRQEQKYTKLVRDVKAVYPYAKLAGKRLREYNDVLVQLPTERQRKAYLSKVEEEMQEEFGDDLKKMTITQGVILIKLIDRETGNTSYELVKEMRGSFSAFFWQGLARIFGHNLKEDYDSSGDEKDIEQIVVMLEKGIY